MSSGLEPLPRFAAALVTGLQPLDRRARGCETGLTRSRIRPGGENWLLVAGVGAWKHLQTRALLSVPSVGLRCGLARCDDRSGPLAIPGAKLCKTLAFCRSDGLE